MKFKKSYERFRDDVSHLTIIAGLENLNRFIESIDPSCEIEFSFKRYHLPLREIVVYRCKSKNKNNEDITLRMSYRDGVSFSLMNLKMSSIICASSYLSLPSCFRVNETIRHFKRKSFNTEKGLLATIKQEEIYYYK